ncbi:MAG: HprK-related kinase A [Sulfuricellaceae bacterium]|nr:HprK-related kinase A [Sulfuricellaceae bacterium]
MLSLESLTASEVSRAIRCGDLRLCIGHFTLKISSVLPEFESALRQLYACYPVSIKGGAYDFDIDIAPPSFIRRWIRRNALFHLSGDAPFLPMEVGHAHALFEWGLNWTIGSYAHNLLILHSAVVELNGCGTLLAATSGSGKSTLAAELSLQGWRLLSDELALIDKELRLVPCARPVSLKNQSIEVIRARHPKAVFGPLAVDTHKGTIAHLPAPKSSVARNLETAAPRLIIFPRWIADAPLRLEAIDSGQTALRLIDQSFNYPILGRQGFERLADLVESAEAWELEYSSLDDARNALEQLVSERG